MCQGMGVDLHVHGVHLGKFIHDLKQSGCVVLGEELSG